MIITKISKYKKKELLSLTYIFYISFFILILFQKILVKKYGFPKPILYIDEIFVVFFSSFIILHIFLANKINRSIFPFLFIFICFIWVGLISGLINRNSGFVTLLGIFDYLKNFLFIFIGFYFVNNKKLLFKFYNVLLTIAILLVVVAIFQEILFFLGKPPRLCLVRFGLLRTPSLIGHPNAFGLYVFLFFTIRLFLRNKLDFINILLLLGIFLSISRFVWSATLIVIIIFSILQKKKKIIIISFLVLILFFLFSFSYFMVHTFEELTLEGYFRGYALIKSLEVWRDHTLLGVGPGMWGGVISVMFHSPVYQQYGFNDKWYELYVARIHSLDQFYPQLLAETGIGGFILFIFLLYYLFKVPFKISKHVKDTFFKRFLKGLSFVPIVLIFYLIGSGLNMVHFLAPYLIFLGGALKRSKYENSTRK